MATEVTVLPDTRNVDETIEAYIGNWPSLHRSRLTALLNVFTGDCDDWSEGRPNAQRASSLYMRDNYEDEADKPLDDDERKFSRNVSRLRLIQRRQERDFVRNNAALIARAEYGEWHDFRYLPSFSDYKLNSIPLDKLTPEWRAALVLLCKEILRLKENDWVKGRTEETLTRTANDFKQSQQTAQECLIRLGVGDEDAAKVRAEQINKLRYEAKRFGFKLEHLDSDNPFGG